MFYIGGAQWFAWDESHKTSAGLHYLKTRWQCILQSAKNPTKKKKRPGSVENPDKQQKRDIYMREEKRGGRLWALS